MKNTDLYPISTIFQQSSPKSFKLSRLGITHFFWRINAPITHFYARIYVLLLIFTTDVSKKYFPLPQLTQTPPRLRTPTQTKNRTKDCITDTDNHKNTSKNAKITSKWHRKTSNQPQKTTQWRFCPIKKWYHALRFCLLHVAFVLFLTHRHSTRKTTQTRNLSNSNNPKTLITHSWLLTPQNALKTR